MNRFNITYESKNYKIKLMITVVAATIEAARSNFHSYAGALKIVKIEPAK